MKCIIWERKGKFKNQINIIDIHIYWILHVGALEHAF